MRLTLPHHDLQATLALQSTGHAVRAWLKRAHRGSPGWLCCAPHVAASGPMSSGQLQFEPRPVSSSPALPPGAACLHLGNDGGWQGWCRPPEALHPLPWDLLWVPGPGLHRLGPDGLFLPHVQQECQPPGFRSPLNGTRPSASRETGQFSRSAGVLGAGPLRHLQALALAVIGSGRNGSRVVEQLARLQPAALTLVDADLLEPHSLDAMALAVPGDLRHGDIHKVDALLMHGQQIAPTTRWRSVPYALPAFEAVRAVAQADVVVSAVDCDAARAMASLVATLFLRPHLDIGSALQGSVKGLTWGVDARLLMPGQGCVACVGGFAHPEEVAALASNIEISPLPWHRRRLGSLASVSSLAAGLGMRLLEDLARLSSGGNRWLRLEQTGDAEAPRMQALAAGGRPGCAICRLAGQGEDGLADWRKHIAAACVAGDSSSPHQGAE